MEFWKQVEGFQLYEISNQGKIRNAKTKRILKTQDLRGYKRIKLWENGIRHSASIHRLVALAFIGKKEGKTIVNHKNGILSDNREENLEWCDSSYNIFHSKNITKNGAVISRKKILSIYEQNKEIDIKSFVDLIVNACK